MKLSSIHVKSFAVNASNISTKTIDGDEHYVIRGVVPVVDDVVMNGGLYPAEEINSSYGSIEGKLTPLPHPKVDGKFVSANDARALNKFHVGAWAQNVTKSGDKVVMDVYVNKRVADQSPDGKRLIARLDDMIAGNSVEPIHVSTGLLLNKENSKGESKGKKYSWIARNMRFDHVAILLDEPGAATPAEGVGIFVNADGEEGAVEAASLTETANNMKDGLINKAKFFLHHNGDASFDEIYSMLRDAIRSTAGTDLYRYVTSVWPDKFIYEEGKQLFQQKYLIDDGAVTLVGEPVEVIRKPTEYEVKTNGDSNPMKEKMIAALNAAGVKTEGLTDDQVWDAYNQQSLKKDGNGDPAGASQVNAAAITAAVNAAIAPLTEKLSTLEGQLQANSVNELKQKRDAVKLSMNMSDEEVADLQGKALDRLYANSQKSQGIAGGFQPNSQAPDQWADYDLNAEMEKK